MIHKKYSLALIFLLLTYVAFGQQRKVSLAGAVVDSAGAPIEYATVALLAGDKLVSTGLTDMQGRFTVQAPVPAVYRLLFRAISYEEQSSEIALVTDTTLSVQLKAKSGMLKEVVVSAEKPVIEIAADKIVFNVERSPLASGGNMFDAINQAPGTFIDQRGSIMLNGKSVRVLVDDRPLRLSGQELLNYLSSLPAATVASMELISNPHAGFEAEGGAILNIRMKKDTTQGVWGSFTNTFRQSAYSKYSPALYVNLNKKKLYLNFLTSLNFGKYLKEEESYVIFNKADPENYSRWDTEQNRISPTANSLFKLSGDYRLSALSSVGGIVDYTNNRVTKNTVAATTIYDYAAQVDSTQQTTNRAEGNVEQVSGNLNFKHKFSETSSRMLSINLDYLRYRNRNAQKLNASVAAPDMGSGSSIAQENNSVQFTGIKSVGLDFTNFNFQGTDLAFGAKYTHIDTENNLDFRYSGSYADPYRLADAFRYKEQTSAVYTSLSKKVEKHQFNLGVRAERTLLNGESSGDIVVDKQYLKLFPSVFWLYHANDKNQFRLSYGRRIRRPEFWRLNPFEFYITPNYYLTGNPSLVPADIHSVEAMYVLNNKMYATAYYNLSDNVFTNFARQNNARNIYSDVQFNLDKGHSFGVTAYYPFDVAAVKSNIYAKVEKRSENMFLDENLIKQDVLYSYIRWNSSFDLLKKAAISGETSIWFASPNIQGIYRLDEMYEMNLAIKKKFSKNRGFLALNFNDILFTNRYKLSVDEDTQYNGFTEWNDTRAVSITLSLNFGQAKKSSSQKSMIEEEKNRI